MARRKQRKKQNKKDEKNGKIGILLISFVVLCLSVVIAYKEQELKLKNEAYIAKEAALTEQIQAEKDRTEELRERSKYVTTKKYIEEIAREKLGLIYEDEIIFKAK